MHHFVVKFSKDFFALRRQGGIDPPNQKPADVPGHGHDVSPAVFVDDLLEDERDSDKRPGYTHHRVVVDFVEHGAAACLGEEHAVPVGRDVAGGRAH